MDQNASAPLSPTPPDPSPPQQSEVTPQVPSQQVQTIPPDSPALPLTPPPDNKRKFLIISAIAGAIFLLVVIGSVWYIMSQKATPSRQAQQFSPPPQPTETEQMGQEGEYAEEVFYPDGGELPLSSAFVGEMIIKQPRALTPSQGYGSVVNAIGRPTYNFSVLHGLSWKQTQYTEGQWGMSGEGVELGMIFVEGKPTAPDPCEKSIQIAHGLASAEMKVTVESSEWVTLNGKNWDRITYQVQNTETSEIRKGVTQCLETDDAFLIHYFLSSNELWAQKSEEFMKIMDDVYIHRVATR